jgi:hypothetical protein
MERSAVVQADALAPLRQRNALARICDFLEDKEARPIDEIRPADYALLDRRRAAGILRPGFVPFNSLLAFSRRSPSTTSRLCRSARLPIKFL